MTETPLPDPTGGAVCPGPRPTLLVTGMSGAGRSTSLRALEDVGYEVVDNLPLSLLPVAARMRGGDGAPLAVGVDARSRSFSVDRLIAALDYLCVELSPKPLLLFIDCDDVSLQRRFTENRSRHPLAQDRPLMDGLRAERELLAPLKQRADHVIDTSNFDSRRLRGLIQRLGAPDGAPLVVSVLSFSFREGLPREADFVFDARFLRNPHYDPELRPLDGRNPRVADYVAADPDFAGVFENLRRLLEPLLPRYRAEGKSYLTLAIGCTGGRHRSVFIAERLTGWLIEIGVAASVFHRDVERETTRRAAPSDDVGARLNAP